MKQTIPVWQMWGFVFTGAMGTFLHFLFDLTGQSPVAALVSAVNESIWEHQKLLFYPMAAFALWEYSAWGRKHKAFWPGKLLGIVTGLVLIPVIYYTYTGILGVSADWFNIAIFFLAAGAAYRLETGVLQGKLPGFRSTKGAVAGILLLSLAFTVLTFFPPRIPYFKDPVTGRYGWFAK